MILLGRETSFAPTLLRSFTGRFTAADYEELNTFVTAFINPAFDINRFKALVESSA